ncbi:MAG: hypothetical protein LC746_09995 [Acidobacteria bacterium]|nr:hypothetical protein [Acidobacteriota bacterium]
MSLNRFVESATETRLPFEEVVAFCQSEGMSLHDFADGFAIYVANAYLAGGMDFERGDTAMNSLFALMVSEPFLKRTDGMIPDVAFAIYEAFDQGEYQHPNDLPTDNMEEKYTRPMLKEALSSQMLRDEARDSGGHRQ